MTERLEGFGAELSYGTKLFVERSENGRFFFVTTNKGKVSRMLAGRYLSAEKAQQAINTYVAFKNKESEKAAAASKAQTKEGQ